MTPFLTPHPCDSDGVTGSQMTFHFFCRLYFLHL